MIDDMGQTPWLPAVINSLTEGVIVINKSGLIAYLNPAAERMTEWTREEAFGKALDEVFKLTHEEPETTPGSSIAETIPSEALLVTKSGKKIPVDCSTSLLRDKTSQTTGSVLLFRDITLRQNIQKALKNSRKRYKALVNSIEGIVWEAQPGSHKFL